ncbi:MAG: PAS domain-containing protein [Planctomycetota bacterium]
MTNTHEYNLRRLAVVLNDSNDALTIQDLDGQILAWNKGAERMYGYEQDEALRMNIANLVPSESKENSLAYLQAIAEGRLVESFETQRLTKEGRVLDVWLVITCLKNDEGVIDAIATTERDITPIKAELARLRSFLPICAACKCIRDDEGYWHQIDQYISDHSEILFSHSLCPKCAEELYPGREIYKKMKAHNK